MFRLSPLVMPQGGWMRKAWPLVLLTMTGCVNLEQKWEFASFKATTQEMDSRASEGLYRFSRLVGGNEFWGYANSLGTEVIPPQFQDCFPFDGDLAVAMKNDLWGYINKKGAWVINPSFIACGPFRSGVARVKVQIDTGGLWGFIDKQGDFTITPRFLNASSFQIDRACVQENDVAGWINMKGEWLKQWSVTELKRQAEVPPPPKKIPSNFAQWFNSLR